MTLTEGAPTGAIPARFASSRPSVGASLRVYGYPSKPPRPDGISVNVELKGEVASGLLQIDSRSDQTIKAQPGFSGSPVWDDAAQAAVGLLTGTALVDESYADAYMVPAALVADAWEEQFDYLLIPPNPYRGLKPFTAAEKDDFFGRDQDVARLAELVRTHAMVAVVGASGVGKSSLVRAGLLPELEREQRRSVALLRPGQDPWERLANSLVRAEQDTASPGSADECRRMVEQLRREGLASVARYARSQERLLVVVIDQFEELFTGDRSPDPVLLDLLIPEPDCDDGGARIVLTLRADFFGALADTPGLGARLSDRIYVLSPLTATQLHDVVRKPAESRGVLFEPRLVETIVEDAAGGSVALLEFTLAELWPHQRKRRLTYVNYYEMGRVAGALDRFAERQLADLPATAITTLDRLLLRLVRVSGDGQLVTRRRLRRADVEKVAPGGWKLLQHLADEGLIITDVDGEEPYAEFAHEALIPGWGRLRELVAQNQRFLTWLGWIERRAAEGDSLPEARISEAREYLASRPDQVPASVAEFVRVSETVAEQRVRELTDARERAERERAQADAERRRAEALRLASQAELALRSASPATTHALALGIESLAAEPTVHGDSAIRHALQIAAKPIARLDHDEWVWAVAFSPDGTRVASASDDGSARVFELEPAALIRRAVERLTRPLNDQERRRYGLQPDAAHVKLWQQYQATR